MADLSCALVSDAVCIAPHDADLVVQQSHALSQLLRTHLRRKHTNGSLTTKEKREC